MTLGALALLALGALPAPPNVILLTLDTTRADHLGSYGHAGARTPSLDRLAREGARFESAFSSVPNTLPSHATILTGLYPFHTGVRDNLLYRLPESVPTLAATLQGRGYRTRAFVSAAVLDRAFGLSRGFDVYDDRIEGSPAARNYEERGAAQVGAAVLKELPSLEPPYFLWVHYYDPHEPYAAPHAAAGMSAYDAEIAYMDAQIGKLLASLEAKGLLEHTLIAVVADHGESLGEHGERAHGVFLYDSTLRVPLILWAPGSIKPGTVVRGLARTVDVTPTILDYAGIAPRAPLDGVSLRPAVESGRSNVDALYQETFLPQDEFGWSRLHGLRTPERHFVLAPRKELYDLRTDLAEARNVVEREPAHARELEAALRRFPFEPAPVAAPVASEELQERIASLGYVSSAASAQAAAGIDPKDGILLLRKEADADALLRQGKPQQAVRILDGILERNPQNVPVRVTLARVHLSQRAYEPAARELRAALQYSQMDSIYLDLAVALAGLGRFQDAAEQYRLALARNPRQVRAYVNWAELEMRQSKAAAAEKVLADAQSAGVQSADLSVLRGRLAASRGDFEGAVRSFKQARAQGPENTEVVDLYLGMACAQAGKVDEAVAALEGVVKVNARNAAALRMLGDIAFSRQQVEIARGYYRRFLELVPADPDAARIRARVQGGVAGQP